jgi:hypothetical protein
MFLKAKGRSQGWAVGKFRAQTGYQGTGTHCPET